MSKKVTKDPAVSKLKADQLKEITTAFKEFDGNDNGFITPDEMKECLRQSNIEYKDAEVDLAISSMDSNRDGTVSFDEYLKFVARTYNTQSVKAPQGSNTSSKKK